MRESKKIPKDFKSFMMLFNREWQQAIEVKRVGYKMRWFRGEISGYVLEEGVTDWKPIGIRNKNPK